MFQKLCLTCFSLRTPAVQYLWYKGSWLTLSPHKGRAWREWCHGRHRRSTGTPGPAPTSMKDRWHLWVCCSAVNFSYWMILIEFSVIYIYFIQLKMYCTYFWFAVYPRTDQHRPAAGAQLSAWTGQKSADGELKTAFKDSMKSKLEFCGFYF